MAVLLKVERGSFKARLFLCLAYALLTLGGLTMVWPFMVMVAASLSGPYDYYRFSPIVRALWDREDRFMRYVATHFPTFPRELYPEAPAHWGSWPALAREREACRQLAGAELASLADPATRLHWERMAADYATFNKNYDIRNTLCNFDARHVAGFARKHFEERVRTRNPEKFARMSRLERRQAALSLLNQEWLIRYDSFFGIRMLAQQRAPLHHANWDYPLHDPKTQLYQLFKQMYRDQSRGAMSRTMPFTSRTLWLRHLQRPDVLERLGLPGNRKFQPDDYTRLTGEPCHSLANLPFPLPATSNNVLQTVWNSFVSETYPRRLLRIAVTPELERAYQAYAGETFKSPALFAQLTGAPPPGDSFENLRLPTYENTPLWRNFIPLVPVAHLRLVSAEQAWQNFLLEKYGSIQEINRGYGWNLRQIEEARLPIREALAITFAQQGWRAFLSGMAANYRMVAEYLFVRGEAFGNTVFLVALAILATLTVNPLAAYALSRFNLPSTENILLFLLATMAFPAAVTAIPGFLLIRDLGLLNTFAALVLPTMANGMSIFILKGFFDSLPRELYEAATIDGAREWQIFLRITLPMTTPILAVNALHAFVHAYNSWEWALLVCQRPSHWTLAVWMYQMGQQLGDQPWAVMAGFVLVSIPTALLFVTCQKIIMRGIVLPSMK